LSKVRVVVLSTPSLLTEGVATRLGQHLDQVELEVVDSRDVNALRKTIAAKPEVILFEARDGNVECPCPLVDLLAAAPVVRVIRMDSGQDQVQLLTSERRTVAEPMDLIHMVLTAA
jgi:hypothetical protein